MKMLKHGLILLAALSLVACGGGGSSNAGTPVLGSSGAASGVTGASTATSVELTASAVTVPSGGDQVTITATVKGAGNVSLPSAAISFAADSGTLTSASSLTDTSGAATVVLSAGSDRSNRNITVTATSGSVSGTITLPVVGTGVKVAGPTTVALGGTATYTVTATDSKGVAIPSLAVAAASSLNNGLSATSVTTDALGTATVTYTATNAGSDSFSVTGGGVTTKTTITISAENFAFVSPAANTSIPVNTKQVVTVRYLSNNAPQPGKTVAFATTGGNITQADTTATNPCTSTTVVNTAVTDSTGSASVCVSSSTSSPATVQATLTGVTAQATLPIAFVAVTPAKLVLQVAPTALSPNSATPASVQATVTDASGNPVGGVTVDFNRCADPSGGNLSLASAVTGSNGQAVVTYSSGSSTTASNGVLFQATVEGFPAITVPPCTAGATNATGTNNTASLTVSQSALFIALQTGNTILSLDAQTYQKDWVVYVTDSNGVAVSNVDVTIKVLPVAYLKGDLVFNTVWDYDTNVKSCANEDANYNGVLDPGEDLNGDGVLQPGNVISVTASSTTGASTGTVNTGSTGRATISLVYAKGYAKWVQVKLVASAVVTGTESSNQAVFVVGGAAADYSTATVSPPGQISPFGVGSCTSPN